MAPQGLETSFEAPPVLGTAAERRRHLRALRHWEALRHGDAFPHFAELDLVGLGALGSQTVLIGLTPDRPPRLRPLGGTEIDLPDVPVDSLLARLKEPLGAMRDAREATQFEADFVDARGIRTLARGVLMPLSTDGHLIDHAVAVFSSKEEEVSTDFAATLRDELATVLPGGSACRPAAKDA